MEPEESREDALDPAAEAPAPRGRGPRSRKPRTSAAAATPTTAARRIPRSLASAAGRSTTSRSAATGAQRRPRTAPVPPEERTTAADALVELPEPAPVEEVPVQERTQESIDEVDVDQGRSFAVDEDGFPLELDTYSDEDEDAEEELAARVAERDALPAPVSARSFDPVPATPVDNATLDAPAIAPVPIPPPAPAHELVTEPSVSADRAASDAFRDLVGSASQSPSDQRVALELRGLRKRYGSVAAVDGIDLVVPAGSFFGVVGPNGAGKTTTLSMITGLLRPDEGVASVYGHDVWTDSEAAKRMLGVLPDRLRLFDRLTGAQLLAYTGSLRGMDRDVIVRRTRDLATAFGLSGSLGRPVSDYSLGMTKKIAIAAALLHAPRMLVLDEPFESVDPVSAAAVLAVLQRFTASGGTVVLSSHSMELIESACDRLAIIAEGRILAEGPTQDVLAGVALEDRFVELAGGRSAVEGMEWLHSYSDE